MIQQRDRWAIHLPDRCGRLPVVADLFAALNITVLRHTRRTEEDLCLPERCRSSSKTSCKMFSSDEYFDLEFIISTLDQTDITTWHKTPRTIR